LQIPVWITELAVNVLGVHYGKGRKNSGKGKALTPHPKTPERKIFAKNFVKITCERKIMIMNVVFQQPKMTDLVDLGLKERPFQPLSGGKIIGLYLSNSSTSVIREPFQI
jgi:hypothetical protein